MAKVAVAGAAGFIGSHVVEVLRAEGHDVVALDRPGADFSVAKAAGAVVVPVDLLNVAQTVDALTGCERAVSAVGLFDLGASEEALKLCNVDAADAFVRAAKKANLKRVVHLSSVAVYGAPVRAPMPEDGPCRPRNPYEESKAAGEAAVMAHHGDGIEVTVLRPTLVYGPRSRYGQGLMIALAAQLRAFGVASVPVLRGGPRGHHVHVEDVARAAVHLLTHAGAAGRAFNVADDKPIGIGDTLGAIFESMRLRTTFNARWGVLWFLARVLIKLLPQSVLDAYNRKIGKGHEVLVQRGLKPGLKPRWDADWNGYLALEHVYDNSALKSLGFVFKHPEFSRSLPAVIEWYERQGWLPKAPEPKTMPAQVPASKEAVQ